MPGFSLPRSFPRGGRSGGTGTATVPSGQSGRGDRGLEHRELGVAKLEPGCGSRGYTIIWLFKGNSGRQSV